MSDGHLAASRTRCCTAAATAALAVALLLGCGQDDGLAGRWAHDGTERAGPRARGLAALFEDPPGTPRAVRFDTLILSPDGRYGLHAAVGWVTFDSAGRPSGLPVARPDVPATVDSGRSRYARTERRGAAGPGGTLCRTQRGVRGWDCAGIVVRGDTLVVGAGAAARAYVRVPGSLGGA